MTDIRLKQHLSLEGVTMDWLLRDAGELDEREELATSARVALGTDSMAAVNEVLPDPDSTDRRGWWGDLDAKEIWDGWPIGCKNWLLSRAKISTVNSVEGETVSRARLYTYDALQPFIDKRIASYMEVFAERTGLERIEVYARIYRGPLAEIDLRYQLLWQEEPVYEGPIIAAVPVINTRIRVPFVGLSYTTTAPLVIYVPMAAAAISNTVVFGSIALKQRHVVSAVTLATGAISLGRPVAT